MFNFVETFIPTKGNIFVNINNHFYANPGCTTIPTYNAIYGMLRHSLGGEVIFFFAALYCFLLELNALFVLMV